MDLGDCPKVHDLALRADFDAASKKKDYYYDIEVRNFYSHLFDHLFTLPFFV